MKQKILFVFSVALLFSTFSYAQSYDKYRRSSLYSLLILHPEEKMSSEILSAYLKLETPDKYNDHDLSLKYVVAKKNKQNDLVEENIAEFLRKNQVAKRMLSKWFDRDKVEGTFDVDLITERGYYNASSEDIIKAMNTVRGKAMLADAGEDLIKNTFVIVNDITYVDKEANAQLALAIFSIIGSAASAVGGSSGELVKNLADLGGGISDIIAGFTVKIRTNLYQLDWNEEVGANFYSKYFVQEGSPNKEKKIAFESDRTLISLKYIGSYAATSTKTVTKGLHKPEDVFKKVLGRAIDNNIAELQRQFEVFRVKVPIQSVNNNIVKVNIGMKEGITASSKFEVLEKIEDENGKVSYKRVGIIQANGQILDNRYMAAEEGTAGSKQKETSFKIISGSNIYPGMLVREIK